jgi:AraC family transcriptional regulator, regulatory protein of adaptative response / methylated-DNA-[protein]-cysteine methyltransferase
MKEERHWIDAFFLGAMPVMKHKLPHPDTLYSALLSRDSTYDGTFIVGVKTTGIFCRPVCSARKPKRENVEFFASTKEALQHGYRPCRKCNPMGNRGEIPDWLKPLLNEVAKTPDIRLKEGDLRRRGVDPNRVRRWFKKHHGITFQSYLRSLRIGRAYGRLRHGEKVITAAFESGYDSLSGFTESFKKTTGFAPRRSREGELITVTRIPTPLGPMLAGVADDGICLFEFTDRRMLETQLTRLRRLFKAEVTPGTHRLFDPLTDEVNRYFDGSLEEFTVPLSLRGTEFQLATWHALLKIPYGETRSYQEQAIAIGKPTAVRAVARANGDNRIAVIIPCHRVIGKDGRLTGYGGGLERKKFLLDLEARGHRAVPGSLFP